MAVTIRDIARESGVSRTTVSRVINNSGYVKEDTRKKVEEAIKKLNYSPNAIARSLSTQKTNTIGVVVPEIDNPFFGEIVRGISEEADKAGLNIILCNTDSRESKELEALQLLKEQRIQGILITPTYTEDAHNQNYMKTIDQSGVPVIILDGFVPYSGFNSVFINHKKGGNIATQTLIDAGHKKIAIINGDMKTRPARERYEGFLSALDKNNIQRNEAYEFYADYNWRKSYERTKEILTMDDGPTAVFVTSNMMILGCMRALNEFGKRMPEDLAIIGFDNVDMLSIIGMKVSYVYGPSFEMGRRGMQLLRQVINQRASGQMRNEKTILTPELMLKGSEKRI